MSMKLYYYFDNCIFYCYTECSEAFDVYGLVKRVFELRNVKYSFPETIQTVMNILDLGIDGFISDPDKYEPISQKYKRKSREVSLPVYNSNVLQSLSKYYPPEWLREGITEEIMDDFNILYSFPRNKIIIPHYDIHDNLVGIRGRALNDYEVAMGNKYMPFQIEGVLYTHPLSWNLYGLNKAYQHIRQTGQAILFEGEVSP